ncbi:MAG: hypothetical protein JKX70_06910 [Phycisphaerales bacterium]|nr:hypothetical protein [Phycisphaerales bacterium]
MAESSDIEILDDNWVDGSKIDPGEYLADVSSKLISGVLGLMGFSTALMIGLLAQNPASVTIGRALIAMFVCAFIGRMLGVVGEVCVREFVSTYKHNRPEPEKPKELVALDDTKKAHQTVMSTLKKAA